MAYLMERSMRKSTHVFRDYVQKLAITPPAPPLRYQKTLFIPFLSNRILCRVSVSSIYDFPSVQRCCESWLGMGGWEAG